MCYKDSYKKIQKNFMYFSVFETKQKTVHICKINFFCTYAKFLEKKKSFFRKNFFATGLIFERFLAPRSRSFEKSGSFENSYIPDNPRTPKPLTLSKNRLRGAKNRSNTSQVAKKIPKKQLCKKIVGNFFCDRAFSRYRFFEKVNGLGVLGFSGIYEILKEPDSIYIYEGNFIKHMACWMKTQLHYHEFDLPQKPEKIRKYTPGS
ncbi:hypothetical protein LXL04_030013 [Taraxacum kok-saghyz]